MKIFNYARMTLFLIVCLLFMAPAQAENKTDQSKTWTVIQSDGFEDGFGNWNDGGSGCSIASKPAYANRGKKCIRLRGNMDGSMYTNPLDISSSNRVSVSFSYYTKGIDQSNEGFRLQISKDGGTTYSNIGEWNRGDDCVNGKRYNDDLIIDGPFTENTVFRFRCEASGKHDSVYIDDVVVSADSESSPSGHPHVSDNNGSWEIVVKAINAGGPAYTASDGTPYRADEHYAGGDSWLVASDIAETEDSSLYKSQRFGSSPFSYAIPLSNGHYTVILKIAELYYTSAGSSVFDINVEGTTVLRHLDVFAESGPYVAHDEAVDVVVTDGELNMSFIPSAGDAFISAIKIIADDSDGDHISDPDEIEIYGTDPHKADTDLDGVDDGAERDYWKDQWNADDDNDGLYNLIDPDSDNDGNDDSKEYNLNTNHIPAHFNGQRMEFSQPDGSIVDVLLFGDAYFMRAESPDGYTLILDTTTGWICYAKLSDSEDRLISSGIHYSNSDPELRGVSDINLELRDSHIIQKLTYSQEQIQEIRNYSQQQLGMSTERGLDRANPVVGTINQLAILVDFPDRRANIAKDEVSNSFNASSYGDKRGSIKSWATTISNNLVTLNTYVIGYYTAKYDTAHYKRGGTNDYSAAQELKGEVLPWADANFNFATLTSDNGRVRSFNILYAGDIIANGWANSLWPHASSYSYKTNDGVTTGAYYMSNLGNNKPLNLSTSRHELGHNVFRWPDTYDYQGDSYSGGGFAMETDIPCAPFRAIHGWIDVIDLYNKNQSYNLPDHANTALKFTNPSNANEYFIMEYVRKTGWRSGAPDEGLLIWHVDESGNNSDQDMTPTKHYRHSVEQADGLFELEKHIKNGSDGDLFHAGFKTSFNNTTTPNSKWWNGTSSGLTVSNIGDKGGSAMSVTIGSVVGGGPAGYTWCANENGSYNFTTTVDVAYGANGKFNYKYGVTGNITFNNATFGDPIAGVVKAGYYKVVASYALTVNNGSGSGNYTAGKVVTITANAAPSGQVFDKWVVNTGGPAIANVNASSTTLTMPANTVTVTATYKATGGTGNELTEGGVASDGGASNPAAETESKAFDNNNATKWLVYSNTGIIQYDFSGSTAYAVNEYRVTSANDVPGRDPKNWNFQGSNNGTNWTTLDSRSNITFSSRFETKVFQFSNSTGYQMYRLQVTANNGSSYLQIAELQLFGQVAQGTGKITRQVWTGITGTTITALTGNANYPNNPNSTNELTSFEAPTNWADNYGTRIVGYLHAPVSGTYTFWIASDDYGELWLSTNDSAANKKRIAYVPGWSSSRQWTKFTQQKSVEISLTAGQRYYIEALQKEGGGGDNLAVAWQRPGGAQEVIPGNYLSPYSSPGTNVAVGKATSQSSTYPGAVASRAVDGNTNGQWNAGSVSHTNNQSKAWWQVNLGTAHTINNVTLWNRTDCCGNRLSDFHVDALDKNGNVIATKNYPGTAGVTTDINLSASGVYAVRVQLNGSNYLQLAEIEVMGSAN